MTKIFLNVSDLFLKNINIFELKIFFQSCIIFKSKYEVGGKCCSGLTMPLFEVLFGPFEIR